MKVAISGASGFIGSVLTENLRSAGHDVLRLVRKPENTADAVFWDPYKGEINSAALKGTEVVVNLSGENLGARWSEEKKRAFHDSRIKSTALLARTIAALDPLPRLFISTAAIGYYGAASGNTELDESSPAGTDFLAKLCVDWEAQTAPAADAGVHVVNARLGLALHPSGGMLEKLILPFKLGAGGKIGDGSQWIPWIARTDLVLALRFLMEHGYLSGPVNITSPNPVRNEDFVKVLGAVMHRPSVAPMPAAFMKLALGAEMADLTVLASIRAYPRKLKGSGYEFEFPELEKALRHELRVP